MRLPESVHFCPECLESWTVPPPEVFMETRDPGAHHVHVRVDIGEQAAALEEALRAHLTGSPSCADAILTPEARP